MHAKVAVIMGSQSDWSVMKFAAETLSQFSVSHETEIISAHRTPDRLAEFSKTAKSRGIHIIIAGAGGAAHLPGMVAAHTCLPILGVPIPSKALNGVDSLLSIVQMPKGIPVGTLAIGEPGAINAALLAVSILALQDNALHIALNEYREAQTSHVLSHANPKDWVCK